MIFLCSLACGLRVSISCLFGLRPYRDTPPATNLSLNTYTSNDLSGYYNCLRTLQNNITPSSDLSSTAKLLYMADLMKTTKFHAFNREDTTYTSDGLSIGISVFVPRSAEKGQTLPVLVRWHGGALINGGRVHEPWFPEWYVEHS